MKGCVGGLAGVGPGVGRDGGPWAKDEDIDRGRAATAFSRTRLVSEFGISVISVTASLRGEVIGFDERLSIGGSKLTLE